VPVPRGVFAEPAFDLSSALPWFPLIGGAVGAFAGGLRAGLDQLLGRPPSTVIAIAALVLVTGALHQDGLADTFDGLGVRGDRARRLSVMRDSAVGAFGVLALILWALLLFTALEPLTSGHTLRALIAAGAMGRLAALLHGALARPARPDGLGAGLHVGVLSAATATVLALAIAVAAAGPARGALAAAVAAAVAGGSAVLARSALGGSTGDTLGATVALSELGVCLALMATWR
jgi:adenosylcobinamide-GDP ribazoletransferase